MKKTDKKESTYKSTLKSMDTEETFDLIFYRPIGYMWALLAKKLGITPNAITIASIFLGVGAGVMFYPNDVCYNLIGVLLLVWANSFDSADGQLARMTGQYSRLGRILDGVSGDFWFAAIYIAICMRENLNNPFFAERPWLIWLIAVITGVCHASQAAMADYYRQFHLFFLKGKEGSELDSSEPMKEKYASLSWKNDFIQKFFMMFYLNYTVGQERRTPKMQVLRDRIRNCFGEKIPQTFRDDFRLKSKPLMKYTNMLSFNTRCFALFAAIFIGMPWLYFAFELTVLNVMLIYMMMRHEKICANFVEEIDNGKY